jgi:hypothetical protein
MTSDYLKKMQEREREEARRIAERNEGVGPGTVLYQVKWAIEYIDKPNRIAEFHVVRETPKRWYGQLEGKQPHIDKTEVGTHWFKTKAEALEAKRARVQEKLDQLLEKEAANRSALRWIKEENEKVES